MESCITTLPYNFKCHCLASVLDRVSELKQFTADLEMQKGVGVGVLQFVKSLWNLLFFNNNIVIQAITKKHLEMFFGLFRAYLVKVTR